MNLKNLNKQQLEDNLKGCQELLNYYLGTSTLKECPLCRYNDFDCDNCAWHVIEGVKIRSAQGIVPCSIWVREIFRRRKQTIVSLRINRDPEFIKLRIPMLKKWIAKLKRRITYLERKENDKN